MSKRLKLQLVLVLLLGSIPIFAKTVHFKTVDGFILEANYVSPENAKHKLPAVIFLHQGGSDREEWTKLPLFQEIIKHGFIALAVDLRGHGQSSGKADFSTIFNDPNQTPLDVDAALTFLKNTDSVDMSRVAIIGASIGGNLAAAVSGSARFKIKSAVVMSAKTSAVSNLAAQPLESLNLHSVYYLAAELEQDGKRAQWATQLFYATTGERKLSIIKGSHAHGVALFKDKPSLQEDIYNWILETL